MSDYQEMQRDIEQLDYEIDCLEEAYKKILDFMELCDNADLGIDYTDVRDEIDNELTKRKDMRDELQGQINEMDTRALNNEYMRSRWPV